MLNSVTARPHAAPARPVGAATPAAPAAKAPQAAAKPAAAEKISGEFSILERWFDPLRETYTVVVDGERIGMLQAKLFSRTPAWVLKDADGKKIGEVSQKALALGFETTVRDEKGRKVGQVKQDLIRSAFNPSAALRIVDAEGDVVAKTDPIWLTFKGRIDLKNDKGQKIGEFNNKVLSLREAFKLKLDEPMDKRLALGFLASQIELKMQEEALREEEERDRQEKKAAKP